MFIEGMAWPLSIQGGHWRSEGCCAEADARRKSRSRVSTCCSLGTAYPLSIRAFEP